MLSFDLLVRSSKSSSLSLWCKVGKMSLDGFVTKAKRKRAEDCSLTTTPTKKKAPQNDLKAPKPDPDACRIATSPNKTPGSSPNSSLFDDLPKIEVKPCISDLKWKKLSAENLDCDYVQLYSKKEADDLLRRCEETLVYNEGDLAKVQLFGKWYDIPRKQVAHGEPGLSYSFSGNTVPAKPWNSLLDEIRNHISALTGYQFNFVLINRYKDGCDHMGEHKDDERELVPGHPIASLSLGQPRDFIFKHQDARGKNASRKLEPVKVELQHGSLLMMNHPTNSFWYHALPARKRLPNLRINMTFRMMVPSKCKPVSST